MPYCARAGLALTTLVGGQGELGRRMVRGTAWLMLGRISVQLGSLIRLAIVARLLSPGDFGLMAIVLLVLQVLDAFTTPGFTQALIQRTGTIDHFLPSIFVVNLIRGVVLATIVIVFGPMAASFFGAPTASVIVQAAAAVLIFRALQSPNLARVHRDLRYRAHFYWDLASTVAALVTVIALLPFVHTVWLLVIALLVEELARAVGSYVIAPWRPRLRVAWRDVLELNRFGRWIVVGSIVVFLSLQLDNIVVGRALGTTALGLYEITFRISQLPATQLSQVASTVAFPALSSVGDQPHRFRAIYLRMITSLWLVNLLVGGVMIAFANPIVHYLLGDQWLSVVPAFRILTVAGVIRSMIKVGGNVFSAAGVPKYDVLMNTARLMVFVLILVPLVKLWGIQGAAFAVLISITSVIPMYLLLIRRITGVRPGDHLTHVLAWYSRLATRLDVGR